MDEAVEIGVEGRAGIVTLNREKAINALTGEMIAAISAALAAWKDDPSIALVLFEGRGDKGFCAGGDVRAAREMVLSGRIADADRYFADEYAMNGMIATYEKPIVALQHGFVMGGGIGLSSHARYRIATQTSRFAMPEAAIGFFSDVGVNAILYQTAEHRALAFLMSGTPVGPGDAMALGLADAMVADEARPVLRERVIEAAQAADPDMAVASIITAEAIDSHPARFCAAADTLRLAFEGQSAADIVDNLASLAGDGDPGAAALHQVMAAHCPTSLAAIAASHRLARRLRDVAAILALDTDLASFMARRPDFPEGVRAVLIDKDRKPNWAPERISEVDHMALEQVLGAHQPRRAYG